MHYNSNFIRTLMISFFSFLSFLFFLCCKRIILNVYCIFLKSAIGRIIFILYTFCIFKIVDNFRELHFATRINSFMNLSISYLHLRSMGLSCKYISNTWLSFSLESFARASNDVAISVNDRRNASLNILC